MSFVLRSLALFASAPYGTSGAKVNFYTYASADALATVMTAGYFNDARNKLLAGDVIFAVVGMGGTVELVTLTALSVPSSGDVTVTTDATDEGGAARAVIPTADGLSTGLILASDRYIGVTSAGANDIITLPAIADVPLGKEIWGKNGATACEMRTPASSNTPINGTDADSTEAVIAANVAFMVKKVSATAWALLTLTGGAVAAPTPD